MDTIRLTGFIPQLTPRERSPAPFPSSDDARSDDYRRQRTRGVGTAGRETNKDTKAQLSHRPSPQALKTHPLESA